MNLELNEEIENLKYRAFKGKITEQMLELLADGRVPLSSADLMRKRLEVHFSSYPQVVRDSWLNEDLLTGDGFLLHPDGQVKVICNANLLKDLNPQTPLLERRVHLPYGNSYGRQECEGGELGLGEDREASIAAYEEIDEPEFTEEQIKKDKIGTIWLTLADNDNALLEAYMQVARENWEGDKTDHWFEKDFMRVRMDYNLPKPKVVIGGFWGHRKYNRCNIVGQTVLYRGDATDVDIIVGKRLLPRNDSQDLKISPDIGLEVAIGRLYDHLRCLPRTDAISKDGLREALAPLYLREDHD